MAGPTIGAVQLSDSQSVPGVAGYGLRVTPLSEVPGSMSYAEIDSLSNSRQAVTPPANCTGVEIWYLDPAGNSTGQLVIVVLDAASDADAASKIAVAGARAFVPVGSGFREFRAPDDYITRVDLKTSAAETNTNKIFIVFRAE